MAGMRPMPANPLLYEINTWPWLEGLGRAAGRRVTLDTVPDGAWDALAGLGTDAVWLMGVWRRSPAGTAIALADPARVAGFRRVLPDLADGDIVGSAYCIREYVVDDHLGGPKGLAVARRALAARGVRLVLDFVPNHVAPDHPWTRHRPGVFVTGTDEDLARDPSSFLRTAERVLACGRDPYFPAWPDVVQLNAFSDELREAASETLAGILDQCDGVRCDMAMLMLNDVFERTWGPRAGPAPATEFWTDVIDTVRVDHPDALLLAEAYWDTEWRLQQLGFDACYDKRLYDRLVHADAEAVRLHLCADLDYQHGLVRFVENHDEPRAAATFPGDRHRAGAVTALTQPGVRLVHDGQLQGRRVQLPVFLRPGPRRALGRGSGGLVCAPAACGEPACAPLGPVGPVRPVGLARQRPLDAARRLVLDGQLGRRRRRPGAMAHRRQPGRHAGRGPCFGPGSVERPARPDRAPGGPRPRHRLRPHG